MSNQQETAADIILINGRIATMNQNKSFVSSVAIRDSIFVQVGNNEDNILSK